MYKLKVVDVMANDKPNFYRSNVPNQKFQLLVAIRNALICAEKKCTVVGEATKGPIHEGIFRSWEGP